MDSLKISTGEKRIPVTRDGMNTGELVFNPSDVVFAEKFYRLLGEFQAKLTEYKTKAQDLESDTRTDENNIPLNMDERIALLKESCFLVRDRIDTVFGVGTTQMVFGDAVNMDVIKQFLEGVTPFISPARVEKINKYTNKRPRRK